MEIKTGYYAPLTMSGMSEIILLKWSSYVCLGTLLVNDVIASCFSNIDNHEMVQFYLSPLRWYYRLSRLLLIEKPFGDQIVNGMHYIPQKLYQIVQSIYPSILRLS
jgi:hypothetical protein